MYIFGMHYNICDMQTLRLICDCMYCHTSDIYMRDFRNQQSYSLLLHIHIEEKERKSCEPDWNLHFLDDHQTNRPQFSLAQQLTSFIQINVSSIKHQMVIAVYVYCRYIRRRKKGMSCEPNSNLHCWDECQPLHHISISTTNLFLKSELVFQP